VISSALSSVADRLDAKFLTAYWLPPFVFMLGCFGILGVLVGGEQFDAWIHELESFEQGLAVLLLILAVTMAAFILRALARPIVTAFLGEILPRAVADWSTRGQLKNKRRAMPLLMQQAVDPTQPNSTSGQLRRRRRDYPIDDAATQPTRFGNIMATAAEHPWLAYAMEGGPWWSRLSQVVPEAFQAKMSEVVVPMMALLNLSIVFAILAFGGAIIFIVAGGHTIATLVVLIGGLILARLCYLGAVHQAAEMGNLVRVGFDLYRHEILRQMDLEVPTDHAAERELWGQLNERLFGVPPVASPPADNAAPKGEHAQS
jgi:hypothetical protein